MNRVVRLLLVEDVADDAELMLRELRRRGIQCAWRRVDTEEAFRRELQEFAPEIILSDSSMPLFDGMAALAIAREAVPETPFIFVSGTLGEEYAIRALKSGAIDYVLKSNLARLPPALERAINDAELGAARKRADRLLRLEHTVTLGLAEAESVQTTLQAAMRAICETENFEYGQYWRADERAGVLRADAFWVAPGAEAVTAGFIEASRDVVFQRGVGLIGTVWQTGQPLWVTDVTQDPRVLRKDLARETGLRGAFRFAATSGEKVLGVFDFASRQLRDPDERLLQAVRVIGSQIGQFLRRKEAELAMRESESLKGAILESSLDSLVTIDHEGKIVEFNPAAEATFGFSRDQVLGKSMAELLIPPRLRDAHRRGLAHYVATGEGPILGKRLELQAVRADGAEFPIELAIVAIKSRSTPLFTGFIRDITERKQAEAKIQRLTRVHAVLSGINAAIVRIRERQELFQEACRIAVDSGEFRMAWVGIVDREAGLVKPVASAGAVGDFFDVAPLAVMENKSGGHGLAGRAVRDMKPMISNDARNDPQRLMKKELAERGINSVAIIPLIVGREAVGVLALYAAEVGTFDDEEMRLLLELAGDVAFALEHIGKTEKLDYLSYYDSMTGLANRTLFHERLEQSILNAAEERRTLGLALFDIERFKSINDSLGRQIGDAVLKQIAERMTRFSASVTRAARTGADQFANLAPDMQADEFWRFIEGRLGEIFGEPFRVNDTDLRISARAGLAIYPADGTDADTLFRNAEAALKKAKATGERYMFYEQAMTERVAEKLTLENKLRQALEREEFVLHYQPKVELESRKIVGVEALIRWQSPELGLVPPMKFIPLLEETGLILQVGSWALKRAAFDHRTWVEQGLKPPRVAVNVSPIQLRQRDFVRIVEQAIMEGGVAPTGIDLEITESLVMEDIQTNIDKLLEVRKLGVQVAIDDFGTGYSSLSYLARLPVETLKIDRSFVITMLKDPNTTTLVQTMINLAHSFRLKVVAEGVESEDQAKMLRLLGCDQMQGYLFSKPLPQEKLVELLRKSS